MTRLSLARAFVLGLLAPLAGAEGSQERADPALVGKDDGLGYEEIEKTIIYTDNATAPAVHLPPVQGWWDSKICSSDDNYCVFTNLRAAKGRGIVAVTRPEELEKLEKVEELLDKSENRYLIDNHGSALEEKDLPEHDGVPGLVATKALRRNKPLFAWTPVLLAHKQMFQKGGPSKKERARLLEAAVGFLPPDTRAAFDKQRRRPGDNSGLNPRSIEEILKAHPWEVNLGFTWNRDPDAHSRHYVSFPEAGLLQHDCRANTAAYIDERFTLRATVARRVSPGEALTVSYVDPFLSRKERNAFVRKHRAPRGPDGKPTHGCRCSACAGPDKDKREERLRELLELRGELRNHDSRKVDLAMIERFVKLVEEEGLHAKYAEAYELAALNFNYLGDDKRAKKYADKAVQAGIVEGGLESNDVVAMRIMANDITGHYSYRYNLKRRGQA
ncbi:hypothetical protein VTJ83DRAFT_2754 [Remersonia thermophila]|uniref:SET domain-containing protein n=1 Tax=Remersonia thermophila TaxID=72144 RepID=A0ABR4DKA7_9PEZI